MTDECKLMEVSRFMETDECNVTEVSCSARIHACKTHFIRTCGCKVPKVSRLAGDPWMLDGQRVVFCNDFGTQDLHSVASCEESWRQHQWWAASEEGLCMRCPHKIPFCDNPSMQDAQSIAFHNDFWIQTLRVARICECNVTSVSHFTMQFNANKSPPRVWYGENSWMHSAFPRKCNSSIILHSEGNLDCWRPTLIVETSSWLLKG